MFCWLIVYLATRKSSRPNSNSKRYRREYDQEKARLKANRERVGKALKNALWG